MSELPSYLKDQISQMPALQLLNVKGLMQTLFTSEVQVKLSRGVA
jgi:hypothetical protein